MMTISNQFPDHATVLAAGVLATTIVILVGKLRRDDQQLKKEEWDEIIGM